MEKLLNSLLEFLRGSLQTRDYQIITYPIEKATIVDTTGANAVIFVNRGAADAFVNGERITTDQAVPNNGLKGEIDKTQYSVTFDGAGAKLVYCRVKIYNKK